VPDFRFILAGDVGSAFTGLPAVECIGRVGAVSDAFGQAAIAVNPVRMGTGLNIKMLDALACGMPCIASESGSRGLWSQRGVAFEVVANDDAEAMVNAILALLADRQRAARLADAGYQFAKDWNHQQLAGLAGLLHDPAGRDSEHPAEWTARPASYTATRLRSS
jgi:glycosyltransferase involved in cell wall biosynthesis